MQHSLPTTLWKNTPHTFSDINKTYMLNKFLRKTKFITSFLNTLILTLNTTTKDIHTEYTQHLQTYKQHLDTLLTTAPPQDTTLTIEELLTVTTNDKQEIPTYNTHTHTQTPANISPLRAYVNTYYI